MVNGAPALNGSSALVCHAGGRTVVDEEAHVRGDGRAVHAERGAIITRTAHSEALTARGTGYGADVSDLSAASSRNIVGIVTWRGGGSALPLGRARGTEQGETGRGFRGFT